MKQLVRHLAPELQEEVTRISQPALLCELQPLGQQREETGWLASLLNRSMCPETPENAKQKFQ